MEFKRVKRKGMLYVTLIPVVLSLSLSGCRKAEQEPKTEPDVSHVEISETESEPDRMPGEEQEVEPGEDHALTFPENVSETAGKVTFNMDIIVDAGLTENSVVTAKAQMQKVNQEKAFRLFFSDITAYDTYDYEEEDEYGKMAHQVTYVSPEETTLAYGPWSSKLDYMERDLMPYVLNAFVPFQDERYNANLYSTETQFFFMTRREAFDQIQSALRESGIEMDASCICYALDHETMRSQEYHEDMDGNIDRSQYKTQWSESDDCYYFYINQIYRGLPLYHVYNQVFGDAGDMNAPVQAVVSGEGIEWLEIERVFAFSDEQGGVSLADMDAVMKTVADKYNQAPGDTTYEMTKAELYYYVDLSSGMGIYDVKPVWILTGSERGGKIIQVIIDAQTAEEVNSPAAGSGV